MVGPAQSAKYPELTIDAIQDTLVAPATPAPGSFAPRSTITWQIGWSRSLSPLLAASVSEAAQGGAPDRVKDVQVLVFDTFGTVVDWRSAVTAEGEKLGRAKGLKMDWAAFADAWRAG